MLNQHQARLLILVPLTLLSSASSATAQTSTPGGSHSLAQRLLGCNPTPEVELLSKPPGMEVASLADLVVIAPDDIWAVGAARDIQLSPYSSETFSLTMHFDGTAWTQVPSPNPTNPVGEHNVILIEVDALAGDQVYAAGWVEENRLNAPDNLALYYDGQQWTRLPIPGQSAFGSAGYLLEAVCAIDPQNIWFGGQWEGGSGNARASMIHYNGSSFQVYELPRLSGSNGAYRVRGISALAPDDVWAVGATGGGGVAVGRNFVARWNGSSWQMLSTPVFGFGEVLVDVAALAADDVWASGAYRFVDAAGNTQSVPLMMHWDGASWSAHDSPGFVSDLMALAPDDIYGVSGSRIVHWNGSSWQLVAELPSTGSVFSMAGIDSLGPCDQIIVGTYTTSSIEATPMIVRFR